VQPAGKPLRVMAAADEQEWQLSAAQRADTVVRVAQSLTAMAFHSGGRVSDDEAQRLATEFEKKAYTVARVEARTTTGVRPHAETLAAYTRCVLQCLYHSSLAGSGAGIRIEKDLSHAGLNRVAIPVLVLALLCEHGCCVCARVPLGASLR